MTTLQKVIKYLAIAFAIFLTVAIVRGVIGAVGLVGDLFTEEAATEDMKTYSVTGQIRNLDIEINAADISVKEGNAFSVESNLKYLKVEEKGGVLTVKENRRFSGTNTGAVLTVYVPAGTVFDNVNLTTGAGRVTVEKLQSGTLDFELGAGEVSVGFLSASRSADIEGGAGKITISNGVLKNLDLEMGMGQLNLVAALTGDCQLDLGVGETNITLIGKREDYRLELEKGLGSISVDGKEVTDFGSSGNGSNKVEINGGIGAIRVQFDNLAVICGNKQ